MSDFSALQMASDSREEEQESCIKKREREHKLRSGLKAKSILILTRLKMIEVG
jgi:hypothetical protein